MMMICIKTFNSLSLLLKLEVCCLTWPVPLAKVVWSKAAFAEPSRTPLLLCHDSQLVPRLSDTSRPQGFLSHVFNRLLLEASLPLHLETAYRHLVVKGHVIRLCSHVNQGLVRPILGEASGIARELARQGWVQILKMLPVDAGDVLGARAEELLVVSTPAMTAYHTDSAILVEGWVMWFLGLIISCKALIIVFVASYRCVEINTVSSLTCFFVFLK